MEKTAGARPACEWDIAKPMWEIHPSLLKSPRITFTNINSSITSCKSFLHVISPNDFSVQCDIFQASP